MRNFYFNNIFVKLEVLKKSAHITEFIAVLMVVAIAFSSCKKKKEEISVDTGTAYYPGTIGSYIVYDVDSIVYDEFTFDSTFYKYQIKEKIEGEFTDSQGRKALKLVRYIKKFNAAVSYSVMPWTIKDVWQANLSAKNIEVVEENVRFVKLAFPVKKDNEWNGNAFNTIGEWKYKYSYTDNPETINGVSFPKVAFVIQKDFPTLISREYYVEKYAKDIGMIYRQIINLKMPIVTSLTIAPINIPQKSGVIYTSQVISYGTE